MKALSKNIVEDDCEWIINTNKIYIIKKINHQILAHFKILLFKQLIMIKVVLQKHVLLQLPFLRLLFYFHI